MRSHERVTQPAVSTAAVDSPAPTRCIGLFDSGLGGISVLIAVHEQLPAHDLLYYADAGSFPYGGRSPDEVIELAARVTRRLLDHDAGMIVVACNTASTLALPALRERFDVPFVGIVPAVKPAGEQTRARRIAVLATEGTTQAAELRALIGRFANGAEVLRLPAPGLADRVEQGDLQGPETLGMLDRCLAPAREHRVDVLVLGCTHYAFLGPAIGRIMGPGVTVLEPSDAVARQIARVAASAIEPRPSAEGGRIQYLTSGDPAHLREALDRLRSAGVAVPAGSIARDEVEL